MIITIEREADDKLSKKIWNITSSINFTDVSISLWSYYEESRPTKRHKYRIGKKWNKTLSSNTITDKEIMNRFPQDIIKEAKDKIKEKIDNVMVGV